MSVLEFLLLKTLYLTATIAKPFVAHTHTCRYEKGTLPFPPYLGFESSKLHLLLHQRTRDKVQLIPDDDSMIITNEAGLSMRDEMIEQSSHSKPVIVYCNEASDELYQFVMPLRAHYLHSATLSPLVIMLEKE